MITVEVALGDRTYPVLVGAGVAGELAGGLLHDALDAFARQDEALAATVIDRDRLLDDEFRAFVRKLISYMTEDPRSISTALDFLFVAKAIERIGDHATNIAELVIYVVEGTDVRHLARPEADVEPRAGERRGAEARTQASDAGGADGAGSVAQA